MVWGIGLLLIIVGSLMIVYAMQGSPVIAPVNLQKTSQGPVGEGTSDRVLRPGEARPKQINQGEPRRA